MKYPKVILIINILKLGMVFDVLRNTSTENRLGGVGDKEKKNK